MNARVGVLLLLKYVVQSKTERPFLRTIDPTRGIHLVSQYTAGLHPFDATKTKIENDHFEEEER